MQTPPDLKPWNDPLLLGFLRPYLLSALWIAVFLTIGGGSTFILMEGNPLSWPDYQWQIVGLLYLMPIGVLAIGVLSYQSRRPSMTPAVIKATSLSWRPESARQLLQGGVFTALISLAMPLQYLYTHPTSTQPSSWTAQLAAAQAEAWKIDKGAVLESVTADPVDFHPEQIAASSTFRLAFVFRRPSGESSRVELLDTDPPRVLEVKPSWDSMSPVPDQAYLQTLAKRLQTVLLSPREIYWQTLAAGLTFSQSHGAVTPSITLFLENDWQPRWGIPTGWFVRYSSAKGSLNLRVHPATGQVVEQTVDK